MAMKRKMLHRLSNLAKWLNLIEINAVLFMITFIDLKLNKFFVINSNVYTLSVNSIQNQLEIG